MMGRTHALTGVLAGLLVGRLVDLDTVPELLPFAAVTAGYALAPDLDHPNATATRILGPVTGILSRGLRAASAWLYARTKGPRDEPEGRHRHLTHTLVFALVLGGICALFTVLGGPWVVAGWIAFGLLLAADRLGKIALAAYAVGALAWLPATLASGHPLGPAALAALDETTGWIGIAVALGCFVHCLGDAVTESGCPFLWLIWPFPIHGETWYEIRPPAWLRFRTGKGVENYLVFPAVATGCALALPGVAAHLADLALTAPASAAG